MSKQKPLHKLKPRHHKYIHNVVVLGMTGIDAYYDAGFKGKSSSRAVSHLNDDPLIQQEMKNTAERMKVDRDVLEMEYSKMIKDGEIRASDKATYMRDYAKLRGWVSDKQDNTPDSKLLNMLSHALKHITNTDKSIDKTTHNTIEMITNDVKVVD